MKIDKYEYQKGKKGVKYGIYNSVTKKFQFDICEDTPMLAKARLFQLIGDNARKWRFDIKRIDVQKEECNCYIEREEIIGWNGPYDMITRMVGRCTGTKEMDTCSCEGDTSKCDFYESVRNSVNKSRKNITVEELMLILRESTKICNNTNCNNCKYLNIGCKQRLQAEHICEKLNEV